jgi:hypothetical protein
MRRRTRWLLLILPCVLMALLVVLHLLVIPRVIRQRVHATLDQLGLGPASFELERATLWGSTLHNVVLGETDPARAERITIDYGPDILLDGQIDALRLHGVELTTAEEAAEGQAIAVPLALRPAARLEPRPRDTPTLAANPAQWPVRRIEISDSTLIVPAPAETLRLPLRASLHPDDDGSVIINAVLDLHDSPLTLEAQFLPQQQRLEATLTGTGMNAASLAAVITAFVPQAAAQLQGTIDVHSTFAWQEGAAEINAALRPHDIALSRGETNLRGIDGVLDIAAAVDGSAIRQVALQLENFALENADWDLAVTGASGELLFDSLAPASTAGAQRLNLRRLTVGQVDLTDGTVLFDLHSPEQLEIVQTQWNWLGGAVWAEQFRLDPSKAAVELTLMLRDVDLAALLKLFAEEHATGSGRISGKIPMMIDWPAVSFGDGVLYATTDGGVQIRNREFLEGLSAPAANGEAAHQLRRVAEALQDFAYDVLQAELRADEDGLSAHVRMKGRDRQDKHVALDYELNVEGVDRLIETILGLRAEVARRAPPRRGGKVTP